MKSIKIAIVAILAATVLTGCARSDRKDGDCITLVDNVCVARYVSGEVKPSGEVDMRYTGLKMVNKEISGTTSTTGKEWK